MFYRFYKGNQPQKTQENTPEVSQNRPQTMKIDMKAFYKIIQAFIQTKQFENNVFMQCTLNCSNLEYQDLDDKEKECLQNCYTKLEKYFAFIMKEYKNDEGSLAEINSLLGKNSNILQESYK